MGRWVGYRLLVSFRIFSVKPVTPTRNPAPGPRCADAGTRVELEGGTTHTGGRVGLPRELDENVSRLMWCREKDTFRGVAARLPLGVRIG